MNEAGQLRERAGVWYGETELARTPLIVSGVISQRLVRLSDSCRGTLALASVIGQTFDYGVLLESVSTAPETALLADLDEAIGASVVRETATGYAFHHALLRDSVYWSLSAPR